MSARLPSALALAGGLVVLALGTGCPRSSAPVDAGSGAPPGPPHLAEVEPNDDLAHAQHLTGDAVVLGTIRAAVGKKADEDWYAVQLPAVGSRTTATLDPVPGLALGMEVVDADQIKRLTLDSQPAGQAEIARNLPSGRLWYLRVTSPKTDAVGAYQLTLHTEPNDGAEELEPNNRAADATPLPLDHPVKGWLADPTDEDWFHLLLPEPPDAGAAPAPAPVAEAAPSALDGGAPDAGPADAGSAPVATASPLALIHLTVSGVPGVRLEVSVLNAAGAPIFESRGKDPGDGLEMRNLALRGPDRDFDVVVKPAYMLVGKDLRRGHSMDQPYTVTASLETTQGAAEQEPNDDLAHATPFELTGGSGVIEGFLSPKTDVDYYRVHADHPVLARVDLSGVEHLDLELSVVRAGHDGKEEVLLTANDGEVKEPETLTNLALGVGDTYLKVQGAARKNAEGHWGRDSENARDPYHLSITTQPDDANLEHEPNNQPDTATPIALGQTMRGTIHPKHDVDFFRLDLSKEPVKTGLKATCVGVAKVDVALFLYRLESDGKTTLVQTSDSAKGEAPEVIHYAAEPGVYLFKVQDSKNRESNFLDFYSLRVESE